jgi:hypothetical protein
MAESVGNSQGRFREDRSEGVHCAPLFVFLSATNLEAEIENSRVTALYEREFT